MKKILSFFIIATMMLATVSYIVAAGNDEDFKITLQLDNPLMTINETEQPIDDNGTVPIIVNDRTLIPVRAIIEAIGGNVGWDGDSQTATLTYGNDKIQLIINSTVAYLNNKPITLDVAPVIINDRTMLPIRFIAEGFQFKVDWDQSAKTITIKKAANKYNNMGYVDVTGKTIGDIAADIGISLSDFLTRFGLPDDMPADTYEMAAMYIMPAKNYGQMYELDFATMKDLLHIPDTTEDGEAITEDTPWGVVQGEIRVADYIGDTGDGEELKNFKEEFGFGNEVTADTKWKEIRNAVDEAQKNGQSW